MVWGCDSIYNKYYVTNGPVDLYAWQGTGRGTVRGWGDAVQYTTLPAGLNPIQYALSDFRTNPLVQADPLLFSTGLPQLYMNANSNTASTYGANAAATAGANAFNTVYAKMCYSNLTSSVSSFITKLEEIVKSDALKGAHKSKIQRLIDEAKAFERSIKTFSNITRENVERMQKEFDKLCRKYSDVSAEIQEDLKKSGSAEGSAEGAGKDGLGTSDDKETAGLNDDGSVTIKVNDKDINVDPKTGKAAGLTTPTNGEARQFASTLFDAIDGCDTKNEVIEQVVPAITKDNVIEIMQMFDKMYNSSHDVNETLMVRLMNDLGHGQKKQFVPTILNALLERAETLGLGDDATIVSATGTINKELSECNIGEHIVGKALDRIAKVIADKEKSNITAAETKINEAKVKTEKEEKEEKEKLKAENQERIEELKAEFARDMKQALGLDRVPQISNNVTVKTDENGAFEYFVVKVEGIEYKGYSYSDLAAKLEDYGYKAKDVLVKRAAVA